MDIPLRIEVNCLEGFSVCFFKDKNHSEESPSHYYITTPTNQNFYLVICLISSQWKKRQEYYNKSNKKCLNSLILIDNTELNFLKTKSVIDCNNAEYIHKNELNNRISPGTYKFILENIPDDLKTKIINAIKISPKIKPYIKKALVDKNI